MSLSRHEKAKAILIFTGFGFFILGCIGGADAFLYWTVKWGGYSRAAFVVESAKYEHRRRGGLYFDAEGKIGGVKVEGTLVDAAHVAREYSTTKLPKSYSSKGVDVYWNGKSKGVAAQSRSVNIVEAGFIDHPSARVYFGPPCLLLGIISLGWGFGSKIIHEQRLAPATPTVLPKRNARRGHQKHKRRRRRR